MLSVEQGATIKAWAMHRGDSMSIVCRALIELGLQAVAEGRGGAGWEGSPTRAQRRQALAEMQALADDQLERRRQSSRDTSYRKSRERAGAQNAAESKS